MIHQNLTPYTFGAKATSRMPPQAEMTVFVRGVFRIAHDQPMEPIEDPLDAGFMSGDVFAEDDIERAGALLRASDFAEFKPRAEILLKGTCHTPGGAPLGECPVAIRLGDTWDKTLVVSGERHWQPKLIGTGMVPPVAFTQMPLTWENAFGGDGYAENPVGKGYGDSMELPCVEYPTQRVKKKRDQRTPACFGPINPAWPQRAPKKGKNYGKAYQRDRAPWYSDDFDWTYFQAAPEDQQFEGYFTGDETVILQNLDATHEVFRFQLPRQRLRVFVKFTSGEIREMEMVLDTIDIDADESRTSLHWRGLTPIDENDMSDVAIVFVASESFDEEPKPQAHYEALLAEFEDDPTGFKKAAPPGFMEAAEKLEAMEDQGLDTASLLEGLEVPPDGQGDTMSMLLEQIGGVDPQVQGQVSDLMSQVGTKYGTAAGQVNANIPSAAGFTSPPTVPSLNQTLKDALPLAADAGGIPTVPPVLNPQFALSGIMSYLTPIQAKMMAAGVDPAKLKQFSDEVLNNPAWQKVQPGFKPPDVQPDPDIPQLPKKVGEVPEIPEHVKEGKLGGPAPAPAETITDGKRDLSGHDLSKQQLTHEDYTDTLLIGTNFHRANLSGVSFRGANLQYANLSRADLTGCDFTGADLSFAIVDSAGLAAADLSNTTLTHTGFHKATMVGATLFGAKCTMTRFTKVDLSGAAAGEIHGDTSLFDDSILEDADFSRASLQKVSFRNVKAARIDLTEADVSGFCAMGGDFTEARCVGLAGERSIWMEVTAPGIDFSGAELTRAFFPNAGLAQAKFFCANMPDSMLRKADCTGTTFQQANLLRAELPDSECVGADFRGANLYEAVLYDANLLNALFEGAKGMDMAVTRPG